MSLWLNTRNSNVFWLKTILSGGKVFLFCLDGNSCVVAGIELCHAKKGTFNMVIAYFLRCFLARLYEVQGELL